MKQDKVRSMLSFSPHFNNKHFGVKYDKKHFTNAQQYAADNYAINVGLFNLFGHLGLGAKEPAPTTMVAGTGITDLAGILGCEILYEETEQPYAVPLNLEYDQIKELKILTDADFEKSPIVQNLVQMADEFYSNNGKVNIGTSQQGYIATALKVRGEDIMLDFYDEPEMVCELMDKIFEITENYRNYLGKLNVERYKNSASKETMQLTNCVIPLVSPNIYEDFLLPYDKRFSEMYPDRFGIHHCGTMMEKYLPMYTSMANGIYYDIGYGSDVKACVDAFKDESKYQLIRGRLSPGALLSSTPKEIESQLNEFMQYGCTACACIGIDQNTPFENIEAFVNTVNEFNKMS